MRKGRYKIDLVTYHRHCEMNYCRLMKLLPRGEKIEQRIGVRFHQKTYLTLTITQQTKFTTFTTLTFNQGIDWLNSAFDLRLYHDAKSCDVVSFQGHKNIWPAHSKVHSPMYQPDERFQHQWFLADLLTYCIENGLSSDEISFLNP
ncbi:MAG: DUF1249 domain-containing protein [Cellvibrionales bacterium]|nr:DUF1249 domain-containing protein [Cellvibrionales bacterium]